MIPMNPGLNLVPIATEAIRDVLATGFKVRPVPVPLDEIPEASGHGAWMTSSVNLEGKESRGFVHLEISESLLDRLDESLADSRHDSSTRDSDLADLAGELCNMVAGRIGAGLAATGLLFTMNTPVVLRGRRRETDPGAGPRSSQTGWTVGGGALILTDRIP